ncbi:AraC family transcriptional regulator [Mesorhizobium sp. 2RAF45]|uniref:AraC family transcriptional regulator n=1 Tax=Mesorhizobium sp. 2RAF45 TaxID=3233001 RepID=UPI003F9C7423
MFTRWRLPRSPRYSGCRPTIYTRLLEDVRGATTPIRSRSTGDFAENLFLDGRLSIAEVAHLAGFSSQSHFTTVMKKHRGVTPSQRDRVGLS